MLNISKQLTTIHKQCWRCFTFQSRVIKTHNVLFPPPYFICGNVLPELLKKRKFATKTNENEWKDGAVVYSTSKASRHTVNTTVGYKPDEKLSTTKPLLFGVCFFIVIIYFMFVYQGERNDILDVDMSKFNSGVNTKEEI